MNLMNRAEAGKPISGSEFVVEADTVVMALGTSLIL